MFARLARWWRGARRRLPGCSDNPEDLSATLRAPVIASTSQFLVTMDTRSSDPLLFPLVRHHSSMAADCLLDGWFCRPCCRPGLRGFAKTARRPGGSMKERMVSVCRASTPDTVCQRRARRPLRSHDRLETDTTKVSSRTPRPARGIPCASWELTWREFGRRHQR